MLKSKIDTKEFDTFRKLWSRKNASIYRRRKLSAALGKFAKLVIATARTDTLAGNPLKKGTGKLAKSLTFKRSIGKVPYRFNKTGSSYYAKLQFESLWYGAYWEGTLDTVFPKTVVAGEGNKAKIFAFYTAMGKNMFIKRFTHQAPKPWFQPAFAQVALQGIAMLEEAGLITIE